MKIIKIANNKQNIRISKSDWEKIGFRAGWIKTAEENIIPNDPQKIMDIIESFGSKRFMLGYRKKDGSYRVMHAQRRVNKYKNDTPDPSKKEIRKQHGLILVYDLDIASKIIRENKQYLDSLDEDEKRVQREKLLRKSYRAIYPDKVELIKGNGKTWKVVDEETDNIKPKNFNFEFQSLCGEHMVDPAIAMENENIHEAIREQDIDKIRNILEEEI